MRNFLRGIKRSLHDVKERNPGGHLRKDRGGSPATTGPQFPSDRLFCSFCTRQPENKGRKQLKSENFRLYNRA